MATTTPLTTATCVRLRRCSVVDETKQTVIQICLPLSFSCVPSVFQSMSSRHHRHSLRAYRLLWARSWQQCFCCSLTMMIIIIRKISRWCSWRHTDHLLFSRCVDDIQLIYVLRLALSFAHNSLQLVFVSQNLNSIFSSYSLWPVVEHDFGRAFTMWTIMRLKIQSHSSHWFHTHTHSRTLQLDKLEGDWTINRALGDWFYIIYFCLSFLLLNNNKQRRVALCADRVMKKYH